MKFLCLFILLLGGEVFSEEAVSSKNLLSAFDSLLKEASSAWEEASIVLEEAAAAADRRQQQRQAKRKIPREVHQFNWNKMGSQTIGWNQADLELSHSCDENYCSGNETWKAIRYGSEEQYSKIYGKMKNKDSKCLSNILKVLKHNLRIDRFPKACQQYPEYQTCKEFLSEVSVLEGRIQDLLALLHGGEAVRSLEARALCVECMTVAEAGVVSGQSEKSIEQIMENLQAEQQCRELKPGAEKQVTDGSTPEGYLKDSYMLKRNLDGSYTIPLVMSFAPYEQYDEKGKPSAKNYDGDIPKDQVPMAYREKVQKCLQQASQKLTGPNGEQLQIEIKDPSEDKNCDLGLHHKIRIQSRDVLRSDSHNYAADVSCASITHEVLHLLGLCDDYQEEDTVDVDPETGKIVPSSEKKSPDKAYLKELEYDCRVINDYSIMSNHSVVWEDMIVEGKEGSLLTSGQWSAILYGACSERNQAFNECSQLAYKHSTEESASCFEQKRICEEENLMGANKQTTIESLIEKIENSRGWIKEAEERKKEYLSWENNKYMGVQVGDQFLIEEEKTRYLNRKLAEKDSLIETHQEKIVDLTRRLEQVRAWP